MRFSKSQIILCLIMCLALLSCDALQLFAAYRAAGNNTKGEYVISVLINDKWQEAGRLEFDLYPEEKTLDLSGILPKFRSTVVKISRDSGDLVHLDSVFLGGETAQSANFNDGILLLKLSKKDLDLASITPDGIELVFPANRKNDILSVKGQTGGKGIANEPFRFPCANTNKQFCMNREFYTYRLNSVNKTPVINGNLEEITGLEPLFKELCIPVTGHPEGYAYGWVMNDNNYLYAVIEFTSDNMEEFNKDFAKLHLKSDSGICEFEISGSGTPWGSISFTYSDKAAYQHKIYAFRIPIKEICVTNDITLQLAFLVYSNAAPY